MKSGVLVLLLALAFSQNLTAVQDNKALYLNGQSETDEDVSEQVVYLARLGPKADIEEYPFMLLKLALSYSDKPIRAELSKSVMLQKRAMAQLTNNKSVDVVASMTSIEREQVLLPIRFPLLKGLIGWRLALISNNTPEILESVKNTAQLKGLLAGQVHDWPDTRILRNNGLEVYSSSTLSGLYKMLSQNRIDYLPRAITEIWYELDINQDKAVKVDNHVLIYYPAAAYFFVNKGNSALALEIEQGLEAALKDGSFDQLFYGYFQGSLDRSALKNRAVITLKNTLLPENTPRLRKELWMPLPQ